MPTFRTYRIRAIEKRDLSLSGRADRRLEVLCTVNRRRAFTMRRAAKAVSANIIGVARFFGRRHLLDCPQIGTSFRAICNLSALPRNLGIALLKLIHDSVHAEVC